MEYLKEENACNATEEQSVPVVVENVQEETDCEKQSEEKKDAEVQKTNTITEKMNAFEQSLANIREQTENISYQIKDNKRKEELIDKLHAENQGFKNGMYQKLVMPFVNETIFLIDNYTKLCKGYECKDVSEIDPKKLLMQIGDIVEDLENALYKNGIEVYESEAGAEVDFAKQKIVKTVLTNEKEKDKTVCESLKKGFVLDEKIIRQEQISCYKYEENNTNSTEKE